MRTQVTLMPTFWTRGSGKKLRGNPAAQVLALYLMSAPGSTYVGIYYLPFGTILNETGLTEAQVRAALPLISEIAHYDEQAELCFLPECSRINIGERMPLSDKRRKGVLAQLKIYGKHPFVTQWVERYYEPYHLSHDGIAHPSEGASKGLTPSPEGASKGHAGSVHAPRSESASEARSDLGSRGRAGSGAPAPTAGAQAPGGGVGGRPSAEASPPPAGADEPLVASLQQRAQLWVRDPFKATHVYPQPHRWTEMLELQGLVAQVFGIEPDEIRTENDPRCQAVLARWAEGIDQPRMRFAIRGARHNDLAATKPELQNLKFIFRDANAVDGYVRLAKNKGADAQPRDRSNRPRKTAEAIEKERAFRNRQL